MKTDELVATRKKVAKILAENGLTDALDPDTKEKLLDDVVSRAIPLAQEGAGTLENAVLIAVKDIEQSIRDGKTAHSSEFKEA